MTGTGRRESPQQLGPRVGAGVLFVLAGLLALAGAALLGVIPRGGSSTHADAPAAPVPGSWNSSTVASTTAGPATVTSSRAASPTHRAQSSPRRRGAASSSAPDHTALPSSSAAAPGVLPDPDLDPLAALWQRRLDAAAGASTRLDDARAAEAVTAAWAWLGEQLRVQGWNSLRARAATATVAKEPGGTAARVVLAWTGQRPATGTVAPSDGSSAGAVPHVSVVVVRASDGE
jgi:hypothetical protein